MGHAQSNYPITIMSLASTLNMQYYDSNTTPYSDKMYLMLETADSKVARFLLGSGYTFVQLLTTSFVPSPLADIVTDFTPRGAIAFNREGAFRAVGIDRAMRLDSQSDGLMRDLTISAHKHPFIEGYIDTTLLRLARSRLIPLLFGDPKADAPLNDRSPEKFLQTLEEAIKISAMPEATFTIIHLLKPHLPIVFDDNCDIIPPINKPNPKEFGAQMKCINSKFLHMIDSILEASDNPPVILFQADHSSIMGEGPKGYRFAFYDIYAAYHLPSAYSVDFPKPFTTVNAFPLILNAVFGSEFELQPDRLFELMQRYDAPFAQVDVTEEFLQGALAKDAA